MEKIINWIDNKKEGRIKLTPEEELLVKTLREKKNSILNQYSTNLGVDRNFKFNLQGLVLNSVDFFLNIFAII